MSSLQVCQLPNERGWYIVDPKYPFETFIGGDDARPSAEFLRLAKCALSEIDALVARAKTYLDDYVDRSRFAGGAEWYFEGFAAGRNSADASSDFWLEFTIDGDMYGFWVTRFRESRGAFHLVEFGRIQQ